MGILKLSEGAFLLRRRWVNEGPTVAVIIWRK
jgi:hypothetical protein